MNRTVLVVAAHPDDEILGCGATIAKHGSQGDSVHIVILAEGVTSRDARRDREVRTAELSEIGRAAHNAKQIIGASSLTLHDFSDNRMDSVDRLDIIKTVERHIEKIRPSLVYTHHAGDLNIDHRITHESVVTACRPVPSQCVSTLLFFEVPSSTEWHVPGAAPAFLPNWYSDITSTLDRKIQALGAYSMEMHKWPHPRSIEAVTHLARWRGASVGVDAAEAFVAGRNLIR